MDFSSPFAAAFASPPAFNFDAFARADDLDCFADYASSTSPETSTRTTPPETTTIARSYPAAEPRIALRGFTKSRRGCFNCKRRRIKCQEDGTPCGHCRKTRLDCRYPAKPQFVHEPHDQIPLFGLQDMRLFQHYLLVSFPRHPLGNESVWTHEVPCLSQNYGYLMHAIIGLAASDLMKQDPNPSLKMAAMSHRLKASRAVNKTMLANGTKKAGTSFEEGNAVIATCLLLALQSVTLEDGMADYLTYCRSVVIVAIQMTRQGASLLFKDHGGDDHPVISQPLAEEQRPSFNKQWADMAVSAIRDLGLLCQHPVEREAHGLLLATANALCVSPALACQAMVRQDDWWKCISPQDFRQLYHPNPVFALLLSHWVAHKLMMEPVREARAPEGTSSMNSGVAKWLGYLNRQVGPGYRQYNWWPEWIEAQLREDAAFFWREVPTTTC